MKGPAEGKKEKPCAGCGRPAEPEEGLCRECAERLKGLACTFDGRKGEKA